MLLSTRKTGRKLIRQRRLGLESLERREVFALSDLPVLMVVADQRDFFWQEYGHTRQEIEAAGLEVVVAATTTRTSTPHWNSGQGPDGGNVTPDLTLSAVNADDYSAIAFVGGWGASMYQYAFTGNYGNDLYDGDPATRQIVNELINDFIDQDKYVTAICHATTVLAWARVDGVSPLNGKTVSAPFGDGGPGVWYQNRWWADQQYSQNAQMLANGASPNTRSGQYGNPATVADDVVVDGRIITAENNFAAHEFGRVIAQRILAESTVRVSAVTPLANGARIEFDRPQATSGLNLYDHRDAAGLSVLGAADVQLNGATGGAVAGSLLADADGAGFTFVATHGALAPDTYTLRVRSGIDAFRALNGELLDGDANGTAGGDFVTTFQVAASSIVQVSLPSFTRGTRQTVNVPATETLGLPLQLSNGAGTTSLQFELRFDASLLQVSNITLPATAPVGSSITWNTPAPGILTGSITFAAPLAAGTQVAAYLQATVPATAAYGAVHRLDLRNVQLRGLGGVSIAAGDVDAVHVNAYFGDLGGNGGYDSFDVQQASRMAVRLDSGSQRFPLLDPALLADFNRNREVDSFDVQRLSRLALRMPVAEVPEIPDAAGGGTPPAAALPDSGDDPAKPYHNARTGMRSDVDENGVVDAQDVLWTVFYYNQTSGGAFTYDKLPQLKFDVTGDNSFDPDDILTAIHDLDGSQSGDSSAAGESTEEFDAALGQLLAEDLLAARKKK